MIDKLTMYLASLGIYEHFVYKVFHDVNCAV